MKNKARFLLIGLALMLPVTGVLAQVDHRAWQPLDGLTVRQGYHIEWFRTSAADADGNMAIIWSDTRDGDRDLYMQVVDSDGNFLWTDYPDGKLVADGTNRQEDPHVLATSDGCWMITWIDYRTSQPNEDRGDVYISKLDADGDPLWADNPAWDFGIPLVVDPEKQIGVQSFDDGNGGAVSIWVDERNQNSDLYGQHTDADGNIQWFPGGNMNDLNAIMLAGGVSDQGSETGGDYTADTDDAGGMIFGWVDNLDPQNINLYCNRVDLDGNLMWADSSGMALCLSPGDQKGLRLAPDGEHGAYWVWEDRALTNDFNLYGQRILANGDESWASNGVVICDAPFGQEAPRIVNSAPGQAIIVWQDLRDNPFISDLYTQRISDNNGNLVLHWGGGTSGLLLCGASNSQTEARLYSDGAGGAVYTWMDERNGLIPNNDLYGQRISASGVWQWGNQDGIVVCNAINQQDGNIVRTLNSDRIGVTWQDRRQGSPGLYFQIFNFAGVAQDAPNGVLTVYGIDGSGDQPRIVPSGNSGDYYLIWLDGRQGVLGTYPYIQVLHAAPHSTQHSFAFPLNGISMLPGFPYSQSDTTSVEVQSLSTDASPAGDLLAVWTDERADYVRLVYAQKLNLSGTPLWGDRGVPVAYDPDNPSDLGQESPKMLPSDDGGMFVFYNQSNEDYYLQVHAQRLADNGGALWSDGTGPDLTLTDLNEDHAVQTVRMFENGDILIVYQRGLPLNRNLYAMCLQQDGQVAWDNEIPICEATELQVNARSIEVDGGIVVVWEDQRRGVPIRDLYGQLVHPDGSVAWEENGHQLVEADNQQTQISLASAGYGGTWFNMVWMSTEDGESEDIVAQRYNLNGGTMWTPAAGVQLGVDDHAQQTPATVLDSQGGMYVMWEENTGGEVFSDLVYTHLEDGGTISPDYSIDGEILCGAYHRQAMVMGVNDGYDGMITIWRDSRSTGKEEVVNIYTQRCGPISGVAEPGDVSLPRTTELDHNYPNPFNPSTRISFRIGRPSDVKLVIYDMLGREVAQLVDGLMTVGRHEVTWDGRSSSGAMVASGVYFYRLVADGELLTRSMVLLK